MHFFCDSRVTDVCSSAIAPASPKSAYCWCSTSGTPDRCIHAVVRAVVTRALPSPCGPALGCCLRFAPAPCSLIAMDGTLNNSIGALAFNGSTLYGSHTLVDGSAGSGVTITEFDHYRYYHRGDHICGRVGRQFGRYRFQYTIVESLNAVLKIYMEGELME